MVRKQSFRPQRSAKRRLVRKRIIHGFYSMDSGMDDVTLDTIEEEETLVRMVGNFYYSGLLANPGQVVTEIKLCPSGTALNSTTITDGTVSEGRDAKNILYGHTLDSSHDTAGSFHEKFVFDVKGQRKLSEGDTINLQSDTSLSDGMKLSYYITLFYKKA